MTKEERWRMEGMSFCMRLLDENGGDVEALRKELKRQRDFFKDAADRNLYLAELLARVAAKALDIKEGREDDKD